MLTSFNIFIGVRGPVKPGSIERKNRGFQSRVTILSRHAAKYGARGTGHRAQGTGTKRGRDCKTARPHDRKTMYIAPAGF
ncbi:MAG: hypothetical protein IPI69_13510 [Bacteroidales bacterium]|nr:hypothetical protein [Bacteroidales bacterium]